MEDELSSSLDGKTLGNLRVVDLKQELEKRGLSKSGSKKDLVKRLKQQLEFEKLCEERKSVGECELKKELDAATEQNEFVQRYLAQQQKIYAEQKEMKRLIELEESKKQLADKESCLSPETEEDQSTENEVSDTESITEKDVHKEESQKYKDETTVTQIGTNDNNSEKETDKNKSLNSQDEIKNNDSPKQLIENQENRNISDINVLKNESESQVKNESCDYEVVRSISNNKCIIKCKIDEKSFEDKTKDKNIDKTEETEKKHSDVDKKYDGNDKNIDKIEETEKKDSDVDKKYEGNDKNIDKTEETKKKDSDVDKKYDGNDSIEPEMKKDVTTSENIVVANDAVHESKLADSNESPDSKTKENIIKIHESNKNDSIPKNEEKSRDVAISELEKKSEEMDIKCDVSKNNETETVNISDVSPINKLNEDKHKKENESLITKESIDLLPSSSSTHFQESELMKKDCADEENTDDKIIKTSDTDVVISEECDMDPTASLTSMPVSLSEIQLPQSPGDTVKPPNKKFPAKVVTSDSPTKKKGENCDSQNSSSDNEVQKNGIPSTKSSDSPLKEKLDSLDNSCETQLNSTPVKDIKNDNSEASSQKIKQPSELTPSDSENVSKRNRKRKDSVDSTPSDSEDSPKHKHNRIQSSDATVSDHEDSSKNRLKPKQSTPSDSEEKSNSEKEQVKYSRSSSSEKSSKSGDSSSSSSDESSQSENEVRKHKLVSSSVRNVGRKSRSFSGSRSSHSRESSPQKPSNHKSDAVHRKESISDSEKKTSKSVPDKNSEKSPHVTAEKNASSSSDPPRKKLKINRNNVVIAELPKKTNDVQPDERSPSRKSQKPASPMQVSSEPEREMGEIVDNIPEVKYEPRKLNFPGRKLSRKSSEDQSSEEPKSKRSKWGKFASATKSSQTINISTDSLKNWFPDFKLVTEPVPVSDSMTEESPPVNEDKILPFPSKPEIAAEIKLREPMNAVPENTDEPSLDVNTEVNGAVSRILFIQNLVRPFTLLQLKELLRQTGNFNEEEFWIDKIKSKCFVTYDTEEEAIKTRNVLNGTRWPSSNPKILIAEFSTEEELERYRSGGDVPKVVSEPSSENKGTYEPKISQSASDHRKRDAEKRKDKDRYRPQMPVREWDKDKVSQESPDRDTFGKISDGLKESEKKDKKDVKKRPNEDTPAKLLDDLFQKTKTAPCIYWLPLTEATLLEREEARRLRRIEREKRLQQREQEESEHRNKRPRPDHKPRETENRRSSSRSRSPTSRRR